MREFNRTLLDEAGKKRFESEYNYALFEYFRSPKLIKEIEKNNIKVYGVILDDGCGSGGVAVSLAEEAEQVVGMDIEPRFNNSGDKLAIDKKVKNLSFIVGDGCKLPFEDNSFDLIVSHSVIEHTYSPLKYLNESYRVLKPGGVLFLETPPYYSFEGAHMPRLKRPIPLQLFVPRKLLFKLYLKIAEKKPDWIKGGLDGSAMLTDLKNGKKPQLEPLKKMTIGYLRKIIRKSDFQNKYKEQTYHPTFFDKLPKPILKLVKYSFFSRNFVNNTYKVFLRK